MRKLVFGLLGFAALGVGALSVQPALPSPIIPAMATVARRSNTAMVAPPRPCASSTGAPITDVPITDVPMGIIARSAPCAGAGSSPAGLERLPLGAPSDRGLPHGR